MKTAARLAASATGATRAVVGRRRVRLTLYWVAGILALYTVLGFLVAPPIVRSQLEQRLSTLLQRPVSVERVRINPFTLRVAIEKLAVRERASSQLAAGFDELVVNLSWGSIVRLAPVVDSIVLRAPTLHLVRFENRTYNVQDLVDAATRPAPAPVAEPGPPPRFAIYNISVVDGRVDFDDRPERKLHAITDLRIGIPFISSLPVDARVTVEPELSAKVNGAPLALTGETKPFLDTRETVLHIDLDDVSLPTYVDYSPCLCTSASPRADWTRGWC